MIENLRDAQTRVGRERVLQAAADLIVENGLEALSMADVVERAGVSRRTLYNYFDSRETLLAEIGNWSDELTLKQGGALRPEGLDTLPDVIQAVWRTWNAQGTIHQAVIRIMAGSSESRVSESRQQRRVALADAIQAAAPEFTSGQAHELAAIFHAIVSAPVYERLTAEDGLDVDTAGFLIGWVLGVLRNALETGNGPYHQKETL